MERRTSQIKQWTVLVLAAALLIGGAVAFARRVTEARPTIGVEWVQSSGGPLVVGVTPEGAGARAGLRVGDLLQDIDGAPVASALDAAEMGWELDDGMSLQLRVSRGGTDVAVQLTPDWHSQSEIYVYLTVVGLAFWVSAVFIAIRWPNIRGGWVYSLLALALFTQLTYSQTGRADALDWTVHWLDLLSGILAPALLLHLAVVLSRLTIRRNRWWIASGYVVTSLMVLLTVWISPAGRGGAYRFADPVGAMEIRERLEPLVLAVALLIAVALLVKSFGRSASVMHRGQMRWLLWGLGLGLGPSVMLYAVPFALGAPELPDWAVFLAVAPMLFVPAVFTAALARYRLHDLDQLLVRGFTEVSAIFCTFAVYAGVAFLLREVVSELVPLSRSATRYAGFAVAAVSYPQLRAWVASVIERAFYRKRYSYRATLLDWARDLNAETDLQSLLDRLSARVCATLGVPSAEVLLQTGPRRFEAVAPRPPSRSLVLPNDDTLRLERGPYLVVADGSLPAVPWARYLFPMKVKDRIRAVLAVAERDEPEEPLSTEDRALLATLSAHAATAIEAARLVQEVRLRAAEIEQLQLRQAKILESSAVGLLLLDADGRIQAWNRALGEMYGVAGDEVLGRRLSSIFPLHVVRRVEQEARYGDRRQEARIFRLSMVSSRGERLVVNLSISPVAGGESDGGRVITFDDVTERVKLEEQVLRQERLASLGLLAAGVAHEINTPLTGISSYTQLLLEECAEDDLRRPMLEKIESQAVRASKITDSLLNLARPEETHFDDLDLNLTVNEVVQLFAPQVRGRDIQLISELDSAELRVRGHRGKLQQVLLNLLINARDAVEHGGSIRVSTAGRDGCVSIEVEDDGIGIADDDLPRIFDPFFTTKARGKGTGLGLAISYGIVREHGGDIQVDSGHARRTRFRIDLPEIGSARAMA